MLEYRVMMPPKCNICLQTFNESTHCPRILKSCAHCFCQSCLQIQLKQAEESDTKHINCPICKVQNPVNDFTLTNFPKHFAILDCIQRIQDENPCYHSDVSPLDFICFDADCINRQKFCGLCYYTVHAKCNKHLIVKINEFEQKTEAGSLKINPDEFVVVCNRLLNGKNLSENHRELIAKFILNISVFLTDESLTIKPPKYELFYSKLT